jgi:hypothetical protein
MGNFINPAIAVPLPAGEKANPSRQDSQGRCIPLFTEIKEELTSHTDTQEQSARPGPVLEKGTQSRAPQNLHGSPRITYPGKYQFVAALQDLRILGYQKIGSQMLQSSLYGPQIPCVIVYNPYFQHPCPLLEVTETSVPGSSPL